MTEYFFYFFGGMALLSAGFILFTRHILHAAFALVLTFLCVTALYILANAEFVAVTQIMIYIGGIIVLVIFGVMLTNEMSGKNNESSAVNRFTGGALALGLASLLCYGIMRMNLGLLKEASDPDQVQRLGESLLTDFVLPFEVAAILLLMALIGAAVIASDKLKKDQE
ncbi:NADH-ubiquinone/plastoquinone oxidoreductase chain 6 [Fulvivirga sp. M361]|uniref:NADH-quinone oxidoreductase subunit J family protein n=1 Tax=Fulvivirga sp. M361 TaxID=2594266 RepID=UPI00117A304F|nr:NADH-quinone oxidoreductase subunit J [Fulvivirga sp. M361]TRX56089.1 NADH-ubiquinone/plastoquinone oxidoreductase chain 6 [Fulvivirga sp. M361]